LGRDDCEVRGGASSEEYQDFCATVGLGFNMVDGVSSLCQYSFFNVPRCPGTISS
jgi:hypothetical protein